MGVTSAGRIGSVSMTGVNDALENRSAGVAGSEGFCMVAFLSEAKKQRKYEHLEMRGEAMSTH